MVKAGRRSKPKANLLRHDTPKEATELAQGNEWNISRFGKHIERCLGEYALVFHEIVSLHAHIDVHMVPPSKKRPFYTLVTSGMSDKPMNVPKGAEKFSYAELMLCLPPDWPMEEKNWKNRRNYWPIEFLKILARMPHEYDTWLFHGHTIPNGETARCFPGTKFCCAFINRPVHVPVKFEKLKISKKKTINFYGVYFLYREEMDVKMTRGYDALAECLIRADASEFVDVNRKNGAKMRVAK